MAPVRETCAQALGMALKPLPLALHAKALDVLLLLRQRPEWEVRHSAMLGIKYLLVVRPDHARSLLMQVLLLLVLLPSVPLRTTCLATFECSVSLGIRPAVRRHGLWCHA